MDVFVIPEHRGKGYGKSIVSAVLSHPELQVLRRFALATAEAHNLYARFGFTPLAKPHLFMERHVPDILHARQQAQPQLSERVGQRGRRSQL